MKTFFLYLGALIAFAVLAPAAEVVNIDKNGLALQGYDPVAYFADGKPVKRLTRIYCDLQRRDVPIRVDRAQTVVREVAREVRAAIWRILRLRRLNQQARANGSRIFPGPA